MSLESILSIALLVPMGDPSHPLCRWGLPLVLWGSPGIGKSSHIEDAAKAIGLTCEAFYAATHQPEDFSGVPVPDGKGGVNIVCTLGAANTLIELERGVLFADEISCARPAVQSALMSIVLNRRIGGTKLPGGVRVLAAANPPEEATGGWDLDPPLANRFAHFDVAVPPVDDWTSWMLTGTSGAWPLKIEDGEAQVRKEWPDAWAQATGLMAGFMRAVSSQLFIMPAAGHQDRGRAWPSPRTWEFATRAVATVYALETKKDKRAMLAQTFVAACVGRGAATQWAAWVLNADLPAPLDMLQDGWPVDTKRLDRTFAAYTSMTSYVLSRKDQEEKLRLGRRGWELLDELCKAGLGDLSMQPARSFVAAGLNSGKCPEARSVLLHLGKTPLGKYLEEIAT